MELTPVVGGRREESLVRGAALSLTQPTWWPPEYDEPAPKSSMIQDKTGNIYLALKIKEFVLLSVPFLCL